MIRLKHVLVATDFSEPSEAALSYGRELARSFGAQLHLIHVAEDVYAWLMPPEGVVPDFDELQHTLTDGASERVNAVLTDEDRQDLRAEAAVRVSRSTAAAITDFARACEADILVMGTHGRGGAARLFLGSVAEKVLRSAPCPVLVVRRPEHEFIAPDALVATAKSPAK